MVSAHWSRYSRLSCGLETDQRFGCRCTGEVGSDGSDDGERCERVRALGQQQEDEVAAFVGDVGLRRPGA